MEFVGDCGTDNHFGVVDCDYEVDGKERGRDGVMDG